ncbi:MAG: radical SAM protein [Deltaproteobacteria bacterium]|nr:radical SAM protein [Deltaproteobacteria bacterium]
MFNYHFEIPDLFQDKNSLNFEDFIQHLLLATQNFIDLKDSKQQSINIDSFVSNNKTTKLKYQNILEVLDSESDTIQYNNNYNLTTIPFRAIKATDPRLALISILLNALNKTINLQDKNGKKIDISSFSLINNDDWKVTHTNKLGPSNLITQLMRSCNANCKFCYIKGDPKSISLAVTDKPVSDDEFDYIYNNYNPEQNQSSIHINYAPREIFSYDLNIHYLKKIRLKSNQPFYIVSNGIGLNEKIINTLKDIEPLTLVLSLNTLSKDDYEDIMDVKDFERTKILKTLRLLEEKELSYGISLVATSHINNFLDDLSNTLDVLNEYSPAFVRINIPGYTNYTAKEVRGDDDRLLDIMKWYHQKIRCNYTFPVFLIPSYEYLNYSTDNLWEPLVLGCIKNSPASSLLKPGDVIKKLNGITIEDSNHFKEISLLIENDVELEIQNKTHNNKTVNFKLNGKYPYLGDYYGKYHFPFGIVLSDSLGKSYVKDEILKAIEDYQAKNTILLCSSLMQKSIKKVLIEAGFSRLQKDTYVLDERIIKIVEPINFYFGGNIKIADMLVCSDIEKSLSHIENIASEYDLVISPGSFFNDFGYDLTGVSKTFFKNNFKIPFYFIDNNQITF